MGEHWHAQTLAVSLATRLLNRTRAEIRKLPPYYGTGWAKASAANGEPVDGARFPTLAKFP